MDAFRVEVWRTGVDGSVTQVVVICGCGWKKELIAGNMNTIYDPIAVFEALASHRCKLSNQKGWHEEPKQGWLWVNSPPPPAADHDKREKDFIEALEAEAAHKGSTTVVTPLIGGKPIPADAVPLPTIYCPRCGKPFSPGHLYGALRDYCKNWLHDDAGGPWDSNYNEAELREAWTKYLVVMAGKLAETGAGGPSLCDTCADDGTGCSSPKAIVYECCDYKRAGGPEPAAGAVPSTNRPDQQQRDSRPAPPRPDFTYCAWHHGCAKYEDYEVHLHRELCKARAYIEWLLNRPVPAQADDLLTLAADVDCPDKPCDQCLSVVYYCGKKMDEANEARRKRKAAPEAPLQRCPQCGMEWRFSHVCPKQAAQPSPRAVALYTAMKVMEQAATLSPRSTSIPVQDDGMPYYPGKQPAPAQAAEPICAHCGQVIERRTLARRHNMGWAHDACMAPLKPKQAAQLSLGERVGKLESAVYDGLEPAMCYTQSQLGKHLQAAQPAQQPEADPENAYATGPHDDGSFGPQQPRGCDGCLDWADCPYYEQDRISTDCPPKQQPREGDVENRFATGPGDDGWEAPKPPDCPGCNYLEGQDCTKPPDVPCPRKGGG